MGDQRWLINPYDSLEEFKAEGYIVNIMLNGYIACLRRKLKNSINIVSLINEST